MKWCILCPGFMSLPVGLAAFGLLVAQVVLVPARAQTQTQTPAQVQTRTQTQAQTQAAGSGSETKDDSPALDRLPFPMPGFKSGASEMGKALGAATGQQSLKPLSDLLPAAIELRAIPVESSLKGLSAVELSVKNNSDRPLTINGKEAQAALAELKLKAALMSDLSSRIKEADNPHGYLRRSMENTVTAALSVGVVQTVGGEIVRHGPIAERYGFDNANRAQRLSRFAERVLWPGDSTVGLVFFKTNKSLSGARLEIPVADFYNKTDSLLVPASVQPVRERAGRTPK